MSSTAVHQPPPPVLFGQQPPSSPPFSSPQSPTELQHHPLPPAMASSPPPQTAEDVDMSASTTIPPPGQRHDREDAVMQDGLTNGLSSNTDDTTTTTTTHTQTETHTHSQTNNVAIEVAAVAAEEDAMDTTQDDAQGTVLPNGSADPNEAAITPSSPNEAHEPNTNGTENPPATADSVSFTHFSSFAQLWGEISPLYASRSDPDNILFRSSTSAVRIISLLLTTLDCCLLTVPLAAE